VVAYVTDVEAARGDESVQGPVVARRRPVDLHPGED
jgi:hypothetical protein